jgi:hypothetical protein
MVHLKARASVELLDFLFVHNGCSTITQGLPLTLPSFPTYIYCGAVRYSLGPTRLNIYSLQSIIC